MNLVPKAECEARIARIQKWMQEASMDALFILQNSDLFYFSGTIQRGILCIPAGEPPLFLIQKSLTRGKKESPLERLLPLSSMKKAPDILSGEGCKNLKRIGLEMDVLPAGQYFRLQSLFPEAEFIDGSAGIRDTRMIKSGYEVDEIRHAAAMLARTFEEAPNWIQSGVTEFNVQARLEHHLRQLGHQGLLRMRGFNNEIFYGTVSTGPSASYPTCFPGPVGFVGLYPGVPNGAGERKIQNGHTLMADVVGGYGGYVADQTRVFLPGDLSPEMRKAHTFVLDMMQEVEAKLRPGTKCSEIYRYTMQRVGESPYAETFMGVGDSKVRFVGHGVGLELDEWPVLAPGFDLPLQEGMTIAVEPKIFFPEQGGVGIEDTYVITSNGCEKLTPFEEEIIHVP